MKNSSLHFGRRRLVNEFKNFPQSFFGGGYKRKIFLFHVFNQKPSLILLLSEAPLKSLKTLLLFCVGVYGCNFLYEYMDALTAP